MPKHFLICMECGELLITSENDVEFTLTVDRMAGHSGHTFTSNADITRLLVHNPTNGEVVFAFTGGRFIPFSALLPAIEGAIAALLPAVCGTETAKVFLERRT